MTKERAVEKLLWKKYELLEIENTRLVAALAEAERENARLRVGIARTLQRYERADTGEGFVGGNVAWAMANDLRSLVGGGEKG